MRRGLMVLSLNWCGLNRVGLFNRVGFPSSEKMAKHAQAATRQMIASLFGASNWYALMMSTMMARESTAAATSTPGDAIRESAKTFAFTSDAAMIHPVCTEKGARSSQCSSNVACCRSAEIMSPMRLVRMPSMASSAPNMISWAKRGVHRIWHTEAAIHQGVMASTTALVRKVGEDACATQKMASQMKMTLQILNAQPAGFTSVRYFELTVPMVWPKASVTETYVTPTLTTYAMMLAQCFQPQPANPMRSTFIPHPHASANN
mmetsp:Transcript_24071/g.63232  ORF Transcript_24071/g.63232 Transcript_24071/m.63232 type:complete len:262 (+) Transcript_24071:350-1135(+)